MGDSFQLTLACAKCGKINENIYYAESSGVKNFICEFCKKKNKIKMYFEAE